MHRNSPPPSRPLSRPYDRFLLPLTTLQLSFAAPRSPPSPQRCRPVCACRPSSLACLSAVELRGSCHSFFFCLSKARPSRRMHMGNAKCCAFRSVQSYQNTSTGDVQTLLFEIRLLRLRRCLSNLSGAKSMRFRVVARQAILRSRSSTLSTRALFETLSHRPWLPTLNQVATRVACFSTPPLSSNVYMLLYRRRCKSLLGERAVLCYGSRVGSCLAHLGNIVLLRADERLTVRSMLPICLSRREYFGRRTRVVRTPPRSTAYFITEQYDPKGMHRADIERSSTPLTMLLRSGSRRRRMSMFDVRSTAFARNR